MLVTDTCILIINWNNGDDTIACIASVLPLPSTKILLLDNNSQDNSVDRFIAFFSEKNVSFIVTTAEQLSDLQVCEEQVIFIRSSVNLGFAKGNNVMLRFAQQKGLWQYAWLLNNDAIAEYTALQEMVGKIQEDNKTFIVGSVILDYFDRTKVQSCGVKYYKYFGVSKLLCKDKNWNTLDKKQIDESRIDFQHGASLLVKLSALKETGLMDERYFLYFEEHDWQEVGKEKGYNNRLATGSVIYHKGSVSTNNKKHLFFYYYNRSAILFIRKHSSFFVRLIATVLLTGVTIVRTKFYFKSLAWGLKGIAEGYAQKTSK